MNRLTHAELGIRYVESYPDNEAASVTYLFIHGLGGSLEQWSDIVLRLDGHARTIAIDVPGFGRSRARSGKFDLERSAQLITEFCRAKDLSNCVLVSHSVGCVMAARVAAIEPTMFVRLVFVSGALMRASDLAQRPSLAIHEPRLGAIVAIQFFAGMFPIPHFLLRAAARSPRLRAVTLWPFVARPVDLSPRLLIETLAETGSRAVLRILFSARSIDYVGMISAVRQPVGLIFGAEDRLINEADVAGLRTLVRVDHERRIARCGHWPWLESPAEVVDFITVRSDDDRR